MKVADVLQDEQTQPMPVPRPFDGCVELLARVSSTGLIHLERNRYSVTTEHANSVVSLRIYHDHIAAVADGERWPSCAEKKPRILHVEDDPDIQHITEAIAGELATFEFATSLPQAKTALQERVFDMVLLDLTLGKESGWDLVEMIDGLQPRPSLIVFSASEVLPRSGVRPDAMLVKASTSNTDLLNTIQRVLKMSAGRSDG